jgi:hypothetical protein
MVVAAKPDNTPTECTGIPQPNQPNEVLAYATANSPQGPYTYQGLLMCGSATEWTNQGSLLLMPDRTGNLRLVLFYHDGPSRQQFGSPDRKVHAECLFYGAGNIGLATRSQDWTNLGFSSPTFSSCMANANLADNEVGLTFESTRGGVLAPPHQYVTAENAGNADLVYNRFAIGPWELFREKLTNNGPNNPGSLDLESMANNKWVVTTLDGHLLASAEFQTSQFNDGSFTGRGCATLTVNNAGVTTDGSSANLLVVGGSPQSAPLVCIMHM